MEIKIWNKGQLTNTFLMLERIVLHKGTYQKELVRKNKWKTDVDSIGALLDKGLITRKKVKAIYRVYPTKKGIREYEKAYEKWRKEVNPTFIN